MKTVTVPILMGTIEGVSLGNARKALRQLEVHGYVKKHGGRVGGCHQKYVRAQNVPLLPPLCECCGAPFAAKTCDPSFKEKERERERKKESAARSERGMARVAELVEEINDLYDAPRLSKEPVKNQRNVPVEIKERLEKRLNGEGVSHDAA